MTIEEAKANAKKLEELNLKIWQSVCTDEVNALRKAFRETVHAITSNGYRIRRGKKFDSSLGYKVPSFKIREDHPEEYVTISDNRGNGSRSGDCTTRCISFCTGIDYNTIQKEQFENSRMSGHSWRNISVWSKSLTSRGFCAIVLPKHVSRKVFLRKFKDCGIDDGVIATRSSGHLTAIDMKSKKILDLWNCSGGRIKMIFVPEAQKNEWIRKINAILG